MNNSKFNTKLFLSVFLIALTSLSVAQNKYLSTSSTEVTKNLDSQVVSSNLTLTENLSKMESFSNIFKLFEVVDFENHISEYEMVTVFLPNNDAFKNLNEKELKAFLSNTNANTLKELISHYIIPGRVDEHAIYKAIEEGGGQATFRTINQKSLLFTSTNNTIIIKDAYGVESKLLKSNYRHSKGFFHITDGLALLKK